jgi:hypothetical protein
MGPLLAKSLPGTAHEIDNTLGKGLPGTYRPLKQLQYLMQTMKAMMPRLWLFRQGQVHLIGWPSLPKPLLG